MLYKTGDLQEITVLELPEVEEEDTVRKLEELKQAVQTVEVPILQSVGEE